MLPTAEFFHPHNAKDRRAVCVAHRRECTLAYCENSVYLRLSYRLTSAGNDLTGHVARREQEAPRQEGVHLQTRSAPPLFPGGPGQVRSWPHPRDQDTDYSHVRKGSLLVRADSTSLKRGIRSSDSKVPRSTLVPGRQSRKSGNRVCGGFMFMGVCLAFSPGNRMKGSDFSSADTAQGSRDAHPHVRCACV